MNTSSLLRGWIAMAAVASLAGEVRGQASVAIPLADLPKGLPPKPLSAKAPYQEYVVPVGQRQAHKGATQVIKQMGFEFPVAGAANATGSDLDDQWQRFQFQGMNRFTSVGPEEGTIIAVRVDEERYNDTPAASASTGRSISMGGKGGGHGASLDSVFQADPHPGNYHAEMLRADFTDVAGGTRIQIWITEATLSANPLSGGDFGSTVGQLSIPVADSPLYGQFIAKLAAILKGPKPVGIAPAATAVTTSEK